MRLDDDRDIVAFATLCATVVSFLAESSLLLLFLLVPALRQYPGRLYANFAAVCLLWHGMTVGELIAYFCGVDYPEACIVLGPLSEFLALSSVMWSVALAHQLLATVAPFAQWSKARRRAEGSQLASPSPPVPAVGAGETSECWYHALVWPTAMLGAGVIILALSPTWYDQNGEGTCYARLQEATALQASVQLATQVGPALIAWVVSAGVYIVAIRYVQQAFPDKKSLARRMSRAAARYLLVFLVCWGSSGAEGLFRVIEGSDAPFVLRLVRGITFFSLGTLFCGVYMVNRWSVIGQYMFPTGEKLPLLLGDVTTDTPTSPTPTVSRSIHTSAASIMPDPSVHEAGSFNPHSFMSPARNFGGSFARSEQTPDRMSLASWADDEFYSSAGPEYRQ